jgi:hypothetical protein
LGRAGRGALAVLALALVVAAALLVPYLSDVRRDNRETERRERAARLAADIKRVNAIQRPHRATADIRDQPGAAPAARLRARRAVIDALAARVLTDSRGRPRTTRARRVDCIGPVGDRRPERDLARVSGRYACTAVTSAVVNADGDRAYGVTGYPYRALVQFRTGGLTWCKVVGRAGEGSLVERNPTPLPRACGG